MEKALKEKEERDVSEEEEEEHLDEDEEKKVRLFYNISFFSRIEKTRACVSRL